MTVDRQKGKIVFVCDGCGDGLDTDTADFQDAKAHLKTEDWGHAQDEGVWKHFCPGCKADTRLRLL